MAYENYFTGHEGSDPDWVNPENAHDGDTSTYTMSSPGGGESTGWLHLTISPPAVTCFRARLLLYSSWGSSWYKVWFKESGVWRLAGQSPPWPPGNGTPAWHSWISVGSLSAVKYQVYLSTGWDRVYEGRFSTSEPWSPSVARTYFFLA